MYKIRHQKLCVKCPPTTQISNVGFLGDGSSMGKSQFAFSNNTNESFNSSSASIKKLKGTSASLSTMNASTIDSDTISASEIEGFKLTGLADFNGFETTNMNIMSGIIDDTLIGGSIPNEGHFTNLTADKLDLYMGPNIMANYSNLTGNITISGNLNLKNRLTFGNDNVYIQNVADVLHISTTGSIFLDSTAVINLSVSGVLNLPDGLYFGNPLISIKNVGNNLNISTTGILNLNASDISIPTTFTEQYWKSYRDFIFYNTNNIIGKISREIDISNNASYFIEVSNLQSGSFYLSSDITQTVRNISGRGLKLINIYVNYEILTANLTTCDLNINSCTISTITGIRTLTNIGNFSLNTSIGKYYSQIVVSSSFLSVYQNLMLEFNINKQLLSKFKFYGITMEFSKIYF